MNSVLESFSQTIPPEDGLEFIAFKMVPIKYKVEYQSDGSVHYNIVEEAAELEEKG